MSGFFLKTKPGAEPELLRREGGEANMVRCAILHDHTSKKRKIESTPLYSTFKLKYRKNVKLTIFLMETSVKAQKQLNVRNMLNSKSKSHIISNST